MTYSLFKKLASGLLTGDNVLPDDPEVVQMLVQQALLAVANKADSLHLMTLSTTDNVLRLAQGDYLIRIPETPILDTDILDIDEELIPAVARFFASYISSQKGGIHVQAANRSILDYNAKTWEIQEHMEAEAYKVEVESLDYSAPDTEWNL